MGDKPRKGTLPRPLMDSLCHICPQLLQHMRLRPPLRPPVGDRDMGFHRGQGHGLSPGPGTWASTRARWCLRAGTPWGTGKGKLFYQAVPGKGCRYKAGLGSWGPASPRPTCVQQASDCESRHFPAQAPACWPVCLPSSKTRPGLPLWAQTNSGASQVTDFPRSFAAGSQVPESKAVTCLGKSSLQKAASGFQPSPRSAPQVEVNKC